MGEFMNRAKRSNAGNRMAKILDAEEDEFYQQLYGGFDEEEGDLDYRSEETESDYADSDFSIDENDEPVSGTEEEETVRKRGRPPKFYKEGIKKINAEHGIPKEKKQYRKHVIAFLEPKQMRKSTVAKTAEIALLTKERQKLKRQRAQHRSVPQYRAFTQEELLEEAKVTEKINIKSLEKYRIMEMDKKKQCRVVRKTQPGPVVRYQSVAMPVLDGPSAFQTYERTFITFSDPTHVDKLFLQNKPTPVIRRICPISGLPAKYWDPVTEQPYATLQAFKILREAYYQQLEAKGDRSNPEITAWLDWRQNQLNNGKMTSFSYS